MCRLVVIMLAVSSLMMACANNQAGKSERGATPATASASTPSQPTTPPPSHATPIGQSQPPANSTLAQQAPRADGRPSFGSHYYVTMPEDGRYNLKVYSGSGRETARVVAATLSGMTAKTTEARDVETPEEALGHARAAGADFILRTTIMHWEDRATEWSGRRDQVFIQYELLNTKTAEEIDSAVMSGASKWFTFGGDHPIDLVAKTARDFMVHQVQHAR